MTHDPAHGTLTGEPADTFNAAGAADPSTTRYVLLVEHDDNLALALNHWLCFRGYTCTRLCNANQVVASALSRQPAVVLLDAMLPDNAGYQLCQDIRMDPALNRLPIVLMTPRGTALEHRKAQALGATALLPKPFSLHDLDTALQQLMPDRP